jgi:hypothetical protein
LRTFRLIWGHPKDEFEGEHFSDVFDVTWSGLKQALQASSHSLESLTLTIPDGRQTYDHGNGTSFLDAPGLFKDFASLRHLRITEHGLLDHHNSSAALSYILPLSLEVLEVSEMDGAFLSQMYTMKNNLSRFPNLKAIRGAYREKQSIDLWSFEDGFCGRETEFHDCLWLTKGHDPFEQRQSKQNELDAWLKIDWARRALITRHGWPVKESART